MFGNFWCFGALGVGLEKMKVGKVIWGIAGGGKENRTATKCACGMFLKQSLLIMSHIRKFPEKSS